MNSPEPVIVHATWNRFLPISRALLGRACRDYFVLLSLGVVLMISFHWLFVTFLPAYNVRYKLNYIKNMPPFLKAMIGSDIEQITSTTAIGSFAYMHPISLAMIFALAAVVPTGLLAGQIDRGTVELTLSAPISRKKYFCTTLVYSVLAGAVLVAAMVVGSWIGVWRTAPKLREPYHLAQIALCAANLYSIYLVAMGWSLFFGAIYALRGPAIGWAFALSMVSYLIHFLAEWWDVIQKISFIGPMYYFRPIKIVSGGYDPSHDMMILCVASLVFVVAGGIVFSRRDIAVV
jgi:ABC-2 type transport system permease protein